MYLSLFTVQYNKGQKHLTPIRLVQTQLPTVLSPYDVVVNLVTHQITCLHVQHTKKHKVGVCLLSY